LASKMISLPYGELKFNRPEHKRFQCKSMMIRGPWGTQGYHW
jgi:hypothetical protein